MRMRVRLRMIVKYMYTEIVCRKTVGVSDDFMMSERDLKLLKNI